MGARALLCTLAFALAALPATGAGDALALLPAGAVALDDGRVAVPLRADVPTWYTPEVHARVLAASARGAALDVANDTDVPVASPFLDIRPGALMISPSQCTMGFVHGAPGAYRMSTAGHCAPRKSEVVIVAAPGVLLAIGETEESRARGIGDDWALVRIAPHLQGHVEPGVALLGGPEGGAYGGGATTLSPVLVRHFGHGLVVGTGGTMRVGVSTLMTTRAFYFDGVASGGDSGSPALVAGDLERPLGQAVGLLTHLIVSRPTLPSDIVGTRVTAIPVPVANGDDVG